ncbi:magnesium and cobalt efflux protein CorC [Glycocaulis alkaliphilus]|uniref:Magnesium and cobalt efflux protein CorC n=2 Tax=Glycocaulis alkaliphilus TaxID=1434191 RepID=A0A3T0E5S9_9PROT|nr:magnesium and cobalt efflux protein CorC [Glycocaulis alkaliphilus]
MSVMSDDPPRRSLMARLKGAIHRRPVPDLAAALHTETHEAGTNQAGQTADRELSFNVNALDALRVADVMVPRADIVAMEIDTALGDAARLFADASHSRLPVYRETLDDPVGVVHIKDLIAHLAGNPDGQRPEDWAAAKILPQVRRPLLYVPPSMRAADLLVRMKSRRMHMALVVDEFGGTDGLVTLEDLLEPIVGEIDDEHDEAEGPLIRARGPHVWEADARTSLDELAEAIGRPVATEDEIEDVDTLGGLVFMLTGRVPERGEVIAHSTGLEFEILDSDPRRIRRVRIRSRKDGAGDAGNLQ